MTPNEKPIDNKTKVQSKRQYVELSCFFEAYKVEKSIYENTRVPNSYRTFK